MFEFAKSGFSLLRRFGKERLAKRGDFLEVRGIFPAFGERGRQPARHGFQGPVRGDFPDNRHPPLVLNGLIVLLNLFQQLRSHTLQPFDPHSRSSDRRGFAVHNRDWWFNSAAGRPAFFVQA